jgi:phosphatidylserine decarboxylase
MSHHPILAREGWPFIAGSLLAALTVHILWGWMWAAPLWIIAVFCLQFFRDPPRQTNAGARDVVCAADGKVIYVGPAEDPYLNRTVTKISVFMNVFNVHSNRAPVSGLIKQRWYKPGRFFNAALDKAAEQNEQNALWIRTVDGQDVTCVQIAGLVARRILCYVDESDHLNAGMRYGFIRFGSRVDLYLPEGTEVKTVLGDKVTAGIDILAELPKKD